MIARLIRTGGSLFLYFCVATILAQIILASYLALRWQVDRNRLLQVLAVAQGIDLLAIKEEAERDPEQISPEQVSYEQIRETRAVKVRYLELREQALRTGLAQLASEQRELSDELTRYGQLRDAFQKELLDLQQGAIAKGVENARLKLEALKPKQAKQQLAEMLKNDELDEVVALLSGMTDSKAGKIMAEFKLPEESQQLYEILRRIREGYPESTLAASTQGQLGGANPTSP